MGYQKSDEVKKKENAYYDHVNNNKPGEFYSENTEKKNAAKDAYTNRTPFSSEYTAQKEEALNKYLNRGQFSYNADTDASWQATKKQYTKGGQQAMKDTLGTATELTGGYDNSYAQAAAQQAYQGYMSELASLMPQFEDRAYSRWQDQGNQMLDYYSLLKGEEDSAYGRWQDEGDRLLNNYNIYAGDEATDYGIYRDGVNDYYTEADMLYGAYGDALNLDNANYWEQMNLAETQRQYNANLAEEQRQYNANLAEEQRQFDENLLEEQRQFDAAAEADYAAELAEVENLYKYGYTDDLTGDHYFYNSEGTKERYGNGVNPYTGTVNPDIVGADGNVDKKKTFDNGYQPNNIGGIKLEDSELQKINLYGKMQKIWVLAGENNDGRYYYWNGSKNRYEDITDILDIIK